MDKNYSNTNNATFKLCPKIRTRRNIQWKFELHFLLFQVKEEIVLFPKKKKMYFLPLLINLNSVISEVKTLDLNTQVSKKKFLIGFALN